MVVMTNCGHGGIRAGARQADRIPTHFIGGDVMSRRLTAIIQRENGGFVALCPELDIASQGETVEAARANLREALELFFECASPAEIQERLEGEIFVTQVEVSGG